MKDYHACRSWFSRRTLRRRNGRRAASLPHRSDCRCWASNRCTARGSRCLGPIPTSQRRPLCYCAGRGGASRNTTTSITRRRRRPVRAVGVGHSCPASQRRPSAQTKRTNAKPGVRGAGATTVGVARIVHLERLHHSSTNFVRTCRLIGRASKIYRSRCPGHHSQRQPRRWIANASPIFESSCWLGTVP